MTKQPHSGTKLRLSKLFHWLAVICFVKLSILGALLLDLPLPEWLGGDQRSSQQQESTNKKETESKHVSEPTNAIPDTVATTPISSSNQGHGKLSSDNAPVYSDPDHAPQGSEAARLAATARPRHNSTETLVDAALPAPVIRAGLPNIGATPRENDINSSPVFEQHLPAPAALQAPQTRPGSSPPQLLLASAIHKRNDESDWLDFLGLRNLPVPGLGSVQVAHAAALDMPIPQVPGASSPTSAFAPPEQGAPLSLPGTPPLPGNIPRGQGGDGAPLPQRGVSNSPSTSLPPNTQSMPVPSVTRGGAGSSNDANLKAQELSRQQQDILMLRQQMDQRLKDMQHTEKKMQDMIREAKGLENAKVKRLILTYSNMKPKAAAKALEKTDERVAIRILSGMTPKQAGEIMTYMEASRTARLTELITRMRISE